MSFRVHALLAGILAAIAAACTVVVQEPQPVASRPQICTREVAPVCGQRGSRRQTFSNSCMARASGFAVVHRGQCSVSGLPGAGRPIACTLEHAPVCARRGSRERTFSNACNAQAAGFLVVHRGECLMSSPPGTGGPVACTREFAPVCAMRGNVVRTFDNACLARASGFHGIRPGRCR
jgi:hypothetical protein